MSRKLEMFRCEICKNLVEIVLDGGGELVCCGQPMTHLKSKKVEEGSEKHLPVFIKKDDELEIRVGSEPHPMTDEHYIQFIECISKDKVYTKRKYLNPNEDPSLRLKCLDIGKMDVKEFCNVHMLWENSND